MAKTKKKKAAKAKPLKKSQPDFFRILGSMGGRKTKKNHGPDYFSRIAVISHQRRRERAQEAADAAGD